MTAFWKKESKKQVVSPGKLGHFWKSTKKHLTLTKRCDQTTAATKILDIPLERQYPYLSFGTYFFEILVQVLLWWLLEKSSLMWCIADIKKYLQFFRPLRLIHRSLYTWKYISSLQEDFFHQDEANFRSNPVPRPVVRQAANQRYGHYHPTDTP